MAALATGASCVGAALAIVAAPPASAGRCLSTGDAYFDGASSQTVIGSPRADVTPASGTAVVDAGSVEVRTLCGADLDAKQTVQLPTPHAGDLFGFATASADINYDHYSDLVAGIPLYDVGGVVDAGAIAVFFGSPSGLVFNRIMVQGSDGVPGTPQRGARFGAALASYRFPGDDRPNYLVRVGEPRRDVGTVVDAGGYVDLMFSEDVLVPDETREVTLDSPGVPWAPHPGDLLGASLWLDQVVGAPGRDIHGHDGAGAALATKYSNGPRWIHQDTPCMPGVAEAGDRFGAALSGSWFGVPGEDLGSATDAGLVVRYDSELPRQCLALRADSLKFGGVVRSGDRFGAALSDVHEYVDDAVIDANLLLIGAPGANVGARRNAGSVSWVVEDYDSEVGLLALGKSGRRVGGHTDVALGAGIGNGSTRVSAPGAASGRGRVVQFRVIPRDGGLGGVGRTLDPPRSVQLHVYGASLLSDSA